MAEARKKNPQFTTDPGTFVWPKLFEPDFKWKEAGEFSVKFRQESAKAQALLKKLKPLHDDAIKEGKAAYAALPKASRVKLDAKGGFTANPLYSDVYDENEEETGEIEIKFTMTHEITSKKTGKTFKKYPAVFDAKGKPIVKKIDIGSGTLGKVTFEVAPYFIPGTGAAGLSLRLQAAQIIDLVAFGQRSASQYGFGEEDGYSASDEDETEEDTSETSDEADTSDSGEDDF
ncbi:hypothetical protein [Bosea sp. MMO-172]|uniref:hypothetical protein n=1 Tax=Bosea sp. MMO-172 TaxID=3127885 RepID=UPI003019BA15